MRRWQCVRILHVCHSADVLCDNNNNNNNISGGKYIGRVLRTQKVKSKRFGSLKVDPKNSTWKLWQFEMLYILQNFFVKPQFLLQHI